jgi:hypothetical protein
MRRTLALALTFSLSGWPALAQDLKLDDLRTGPLTRSIRLEMAKLADAQAQPANDAYRPGGMSPAYFWTAIGLMGVGGANLLSGLVLSDDDGICDDLDIECDSISTALTVVGASMVGAGAVVYVLGKRKAAAASPSIVAGPGKVVIRSRVSF